MEYLIIKKDIFDENILDGSKYKGIKKSGNKMF